MLGKAYWQATCQRRLEPMLVPATMRSATKRASADANLTQSDVLPIVDRGGPPAPLDGGGWSQWADRWLFAMGDPMARSKQTVR